MHSPNNRWLVPTPRLRVRVRVRARARADQARADPAA